MNCARDVAELRAEVAALRDRCAENDREILRLVSNLAREVEKNRALICQGQKEAPAALEDAPALDFYRLLTSRPVGLVCSLLAPLLLVAG